MRYTCVRLLLPLSLCATAAFPQITLNQSPSRTVGHPPTPTPERLTVYSSNPNLVEGREFWQPHGLALDTSSTPPALFVADTGNNRVLAWKDAGGFAYNKTADLVIGQPDLFSTNPQGPGYSLSTGLNAPTGLAVDARGNLYVMDSGNNRVLRFPKPFSKRSQVPDLVMGQPSFQTRGPNFNTSAQTPHQRGFYTSNLSGTVFSANMAFDAAGNLFLADPGNRRVVAFQAGDLGDSAANGPTAYLELGQLNFTSAQQALNAASSASALVVNQFAVPDALAFDSKGRLYVTDADPSTNPQFLSGRVLVFSPPFRNGGAASRIYGVFPAGSSSTPADVDHVVMYAPEGIFFQPDGSLGVLDSGSSRILIFDSVDNWPADGSAPQARTVIGQNNDFHNRAANNNQIATIATPPVRLDTLWRPVAVVATALELYVADAGNNRVVVLPRAGSSFNGAGRVLGQDFVNGANSPNLIEGREFNFSSDAGITLDSSGDVPHLWVADSGNNRVLGFRDVRKLAPGLKADIVIGQPDFRSGLCNAPTGDAVAPSATSLCHPTGVLVDSKGNLYVADTGNGRVLRYAAPFASSTLAGQAAELVIGKRSFTDTITDPSQVSMSAPYGLAFSGVNGLLVSDAAHNRVLYFPFTANGSFRPGTDNGLAAAKVFGQLSFTNTTTGTGMAGLNGPRHIAADTSGRPYVVDTGNSRVLIFGDPNGNDTPAQGATAAYAISGLNSPRGVFVNLSTGEFWVTNTNSGTALKYPTFDNLITGTGQPLVSVPAANATLAVAQDSYGDLFLADTSSRVAVYYPGMTALSAANALVSRPLAPGMAASIYPLGGTFGADTEQLQAYPMPTSMAKTQVLFNDTPVPLYFVSPGQINFLVPNGAPTSGTADVQVARTDTGQVLAAGTVAMSNVSPAIFAIDSVGKVRRAAVLNQDSTVNDPTNAAARGSVIAIYGTGAGFIPGVVDGAAAPGPDKGLLTTPSQPRVVIGSCFVDNCGPLLPGDPTDGAWVKFSGLTPGIAGLWQVNVQIPMAIVPANQVAVVLVMNNVGSVDPTDTRNFVTSIAVKEK